MELVAMILGFIVFWPIGLAILFAKMWQSRSGHGGDLPGFIHAKLNEKSREMGAEDGTSLGLRPRSPRLL